MIRRAAHAGGMTALIVDEAQSLPYELLEEIRLLANLETTTTKLLPVVLAGQPELADRLNRAVLRQLKQRVALRCELQPFDLRETAAYIAKRIRVAGGDGAQRLHARGGGSDSRAARSGIARTISVICDNALISGFALQREPGGRRYRAGGLPRFRSAGAVRRRRPAALRRRRRVAPPSARRQLSVDAQDARAAVAPPARPHAMAAGGGTTTRTQPVTKRRFLFF